MIHDNVYRRERESKSVFDADEIVLSWTELGRFTIIRTELRFWNQTPTERFGLARIELGSTTPT